jgi:hypothetical protein
MALPAIRFWLPTKEKAIVKAYARSYAIPGNLTIRLSAAMVDAGPAEVPAGIHTSTVHKVGAAHGHECNAPANGGKCGDCRACWDKAVSNVSYAYH